MNDPRGHDQVQFDKLPEVDVEPKSSGATNKDIRDTEADKYLGGMRNPWKAISHRPLYFQMALKIRTLFT
eukprot:6048979-Amphidinium_carterae.1